MSSPLCDCDLGAAHQKVLSDGKLRCPVLEKIHPSPTEKKCLHCGSLFLSKGGPYCSGSCIAFALVALRSSDEEETSTEEEEEEEKEDEEEEEVKLESDDEDHAHYLALLEYGKAPRRLFYRKTRYSPYN